MNKAQEEQYEADAVLAARSYTEDVYVGPDITSESLTQMVDPDREGLVYLEPVEGSTRRVIVALLRDEQAMSDLSKDLIPLCFAICECVSNYKNHSAVKWYNITVKDSTGSSE